MFRRIVIVSKNISVTFCVNVIMPVLVSFWNVIALQHWDLHGWTDVNVHAVYVSVIDIVVVGLVSF